jgi:hypothetical protein
MLVLFLSLSVNVNCLWYVDCVLLAVHFVHFSKHSVHINCNLNKSHYLVCLILFTGSYRDARQQTPLNIYTDTKQQDIRSQKTVILIFTWMVDTGVKGTDIMACDSQIPVFRLILSSIVKYKVVFLWFVPYYNLLLHLFVCHCFHFITNIHLGFFTLPVYNTVYCFRNMCFLLQVN